MTVRDIPPPLGECATREDQWTIGAYKRLKKNEVQFIFYGALRRKIKQGKESYGHSAQGPMKEGINWAIGSKKKQYVNRNANN